MHIATRGGGLKNKAFTLIELLAVIVILAVIALIASPIIMGVIGKTKKQAFERSIDGILEAVRIDYSSDGFVSPREYFYEGNNLILLTVNEETLDESVGIKGKINGKGFIYVDEDGVIHIENICSKDYCANGTEPNIVITENITGEIPELSKNDPMIKIKGEKTVYVNIGDTYTELGATAKTKSGQVLEYITEITLNGEVVTSIDTTTENTYVITYKTEHEGKTVTDTRNVVILDMKPVINITEGNTKYVKEQEILITVSAVRPNMITSFTVEMKKDGEVIKTETVTGISKTITLSETGNYEVIVTVTDNHEHTSTITKTYKIDSEPPVIEFTSEITLKANEVSGFVFKNDETVKVSDNSNLVTWKTEGNLNSIKGDQTITYIAIDEAGNETKEIRVFHIEKADGPVLNSNSASSNEKWIKPTTIRLSAEIQTENDELTEFTYQVDDGEIVNVPITNNKLMEVSVALNTTGRHTINITATGKHGNTTPLSLGEFWIDAVIPELTINNSNYNDKYGNSKQLSTLYTVKFGEMGGSVVCKNGSTEITNVNEIKLAGTYSIKCTATGKNEKSTEKTITVTLTPRTFTEIMSGTGRFNEQAKSFSEVMTSSNLIADKWGNKRYVGENPNNYVSFNGENWRIIGVFDGQAKIIKSTSIGSKVWDTNNKNNWETASLQQELNGSYLNSIEKTSRGYIDETHIWYLGGWNSTYIKREEMYSYERGKTVYEGNPISWEGAIGLMYPSDHSYAGSSASICDTTDLYNWGVVEEANKECVQKNWLKTSFTEWTIIPNSSNDRAVFRIVGAGGIFNGYTANSYYEIRPALYLKSNIKIKSGNGTEDEPYILTEADVDIKDKNNNARYVGTSPNNYVSFNGEKWRIIGIVDGQPKIIKNESIGNMAWSTDGKNNWEKATLQTYLKNTYLPKIDSVSQKYIDQKHQWKLGGWESPTITRKEIYDYERSTTIYAGNPISWEGAVGLIYPSDYGYATDGGSICDKSLFDSWASECITNNWLSLGETEWTITPNSSNNTCIFRIVNSGGIFALYGAENTREIRPALYLNTNVKIHGGTGTSDDPYVLGL